MAAKCNTCLDGYDETITHDCGSCGKRYLGEYPSYEEKNDMSGLLRDKGYNSLRKLTTTRNG